MKAPAGDNRRADAEGGARSGRRYAPEKPGDAVGADDEAGGGNFPAKKVMKTSA